MGFLEHILVTPSHHRVHHAINKEYMDKNLSQIFIVWDKLFGTADFRDTYPATGVADQLHGKHYGDGFWETQWLGFVRLKQHFWPR